MAHSPGGTIAGSRPSVLTKSATAESSPIARRTFRRKRSSHRKELFCRYLSQSLANESPRALNSRISDAVSLWFRGRRASSLLFFLSEEPCLLATPTRRIALAADARTCLNPEVPNLSRPPDLNLTLSSEPKFKTLGFPPANHNRICSWDSTFKSYGHHCSANKRRTGAGIGAENRILSWR